MIEPGRSERAGLVSAGSANDEMTLYEEALDVTALKVRLAVRNNHLRELVDDLAEVRSIVGELRAVRETLEEHVRKLAEERDRLQDAVRNLEEEARQQNRRHESLQQEFREREAESAELQSTINELRGRLEEEYGLRRKLAEPENRLRAGIELFNDSEHRISVGSLSRSMGQPEVHVTLEEGEEPAAILTFTWQGITWQTYISIPGLAVENPRVYLKSSGEDLSGVVQEPPNSHVGPGGLIYLGV